MPTKTLSVAVPARVLAQIRKRAQQAKRSLEAEVVSLLNEALSANGSSANGKPASRTKKKPWTNLADWAEKHDEHWGNEINSEDVASFTGRRF